MKITGLLNGQPFMTQYGIVGYSTVVLVEDEDRRILFDCGNRACSIQLKQALGEAGLEPCDITDVVISHLHFDHVGNLPLFTEARILVSETEWQSALSKPDEYHCIATCGYIRQSGRLGFIREGDKLTEKVTVLSLPGHTAGLVGLLCAADSSKNPAECSHCDEALPAGSGAAMGAEEPGLAGGDTILCSDAIKNRYELWEGLEPMSIDREQSRRTMDRIRSLARYIYPGHDCRLDVTRAEEPAPVYIQLRYANGRRLDIK